MSVCRATPTSGCGRVRLGVPLSARLGRSGQECGRLGRSGQECGRSFRSLRSALAALSARCARRSLHSALAALGARCARRSLRSALAALGARCARRLLRSALAALGARCARRSLRSALAALAALASLRALTTDSEPWPRVVDLWRAQDWPSAPRVRPWGAATGCRPRGAGACSTRRSLRSALAALGARCARRSLRSALAALGARCARRLLRSALAALQRLLRSALAALGAYCARCARRWLRSLRSALAALAALAVLAALAARFELWTDASVARPGLAECRGQRAPSAASDRLGAWPEKPRRHTSTVSAWLAARHATGGAAPATRAERHSPLCKPTTSRLELSSVEVLRQGDRAPETEAAHGHRVGAGGRAPRPRGCSARHSS